MMAKKIAKPAPKAAPVDMTPDSLKEAFGSFPTYELLTRRISDPRDPGSLPILLKDEDPNSCINSEHINSVRPNQTHCKICRKPVRKWFVYWGNTDKEGRWSSLMARGYVPVEVKQLRDEMDVADLVKTVDDQSRVLVRRGDRGKEVLCHVPLVAWLLTKAQARENAKLRSQSATARRDARAEALGRKFGDEAGEYAHHGGIREESFKTERTTLGEEYAGVDVIEE